MKKEILKGLAKAKELEKIPDHSSQEIVAVYQDGLKEAQKLGKLLEPAWWLGDKHLKNKKSSTKTAKKTIKQVKKTMKSTRKKKTL